MIAGRTASPVAARETHPGGAGGPARRLRGAWSALAREERLAALAALALWVSMFLPWYGKSVTEPVSGSLRAAAYKLTAFGAFSFVEAAVLLVAAAVLALLFARAERRAFHLPGGDGGVILVAGAWTSLLIFYRMLDKPGTTGNAQLTATIGLQWGIFVALAAAIGLGYAGTRLRGARRPEPARIEDPTLRPPRPRRPPRPPAADDDDAPTRQLADDDTTRAARAESTKRPSLEVDLEDPPELRRIPRRDPDRTRKPDPFGER
jgi:hypothetical protein